MNNEEQALADEHEETAAARERTTDSYDSMEIEDEDEIELLDDDILFETDERD